MTYLNSSPNFGDEIKEDQIGGIYNTTGEIKNA
jgi:hypothetical protein